MESIPITVVNLQVEVKGKPLQADKKYTLATKAYIADGHDGFESLPGGKVIVDEENARLLSAMVGPAPRCSHFLIMMLTWP